MNLKASTEKRYFNFIVSAESVDSSGRYEYRNMIRDRIGTEIIADTSIGIVYIDAAKDGRAERIARPVWHPSLYEIDTDAIFGLNAKNVATRIDGAAASVLRDMPEKAAVRMIETLAAYGLEDSAARRLARGKGELPYEIATHALNYALGLYGGDERMTARLVNMLENDDGWLPGEMTIKDGRPGVLDRIDAATAQGSIRARAAAHG